MGSNAVASDELRLLIERVERVEEEIKAAQDDRKEVYAEAKSRGFCTKTMKRIVRERKKQDHVRREEEAMFDLYKAALGMLDGTPLGNWAVERLTKDKKATKPAPATASSTDRAVSNVDAPANGPAIEEPVIESAAEPELTIADARRLGAQAARDGDAVTANPFPARDPRRAAWDEAWCHELGSDGMEIPEALRPAANKAKPIDDDRAPEEAPKVEEPHATAEPDGIASDAVDPAYADARDAVISSQYVSISRIQKLFSIGYSRAARIVEQLEREGIVSAASQAGQRDVLVDSEGQPK